MDKLQIERNQISNTSKVIAGQVRGDHYGSLVFISSDGNGASGKLRYIYLDREPFGSYSDTTEGIADKFPILLSATLTVE